MPYDQKLENTYCCCGVFSLDYALYLITIHYFLHGSFGVLLVTTSIYKVTYNSVNILTAISSGLYIPFGLLVFWVALYQSPSGARACAYIIALLTTVCFVGAATYFALYLKFQANSQFDRGLLWYDGADFVDARSAPFTFWHLFSFYYLVFTPLGWYQLYVFRKYANILKRRDSTDQSEMSEREPRKSVEPYLRAAI